MSKNEFSRKLVTEIKEAIDILPVNFIERMMDDVWSFGLLMTNGTIIAIDSIKSVSQANNGTIWIDVTMSESRPLMDSENQNIFISPTSRTTASINVAHVMAAFELSDT